MSLDAIRTVVAGESLRSRAATTAIIERFLAHAPLPPRAPEGMPFTARERAITALVATGMFDDEIADRPSSAPPPR